MDDYIVGGVIGVCGLAAIVFVVYCCSSSTPRLHYCFEPQKDMTAYELAMSNKLQWGDYPASTYQVLDPAIKRHWVQCP